MKNSVLLVLAVFGGLGCNPRDIALLERQKRFRVCMESAFRRVRPYSKKEFDYPATLPDIPCAVSEITGYKLIYFSTLKPRRTLVLMAYRSADDYFFYTDASAQELGVLYGDRFKTIGIDLSSLKLDPTDHRKEQGYYIGDYTAFTRSGRYI